MYGNVNGERDSYMNIHAVPAKQNNSRPTSIGLDLWSQLKLVQMPVFYGDKLLYSVGRIDVRRYIIGFYIKLTIFHLEQGI